MERRSFLWLSFLGSAALCLPMGACSSFTESTASVAVLSQPITLSGFCSAETLKEIGVQYRQQVPAEDSQEVLQKLILSDIGEKLTQAGADDAGIRTAIQEKIKQDFEAGRMVKMLGWILSETEARQCALFSTL